METITVYKVVRVDGSGLRSLCAGNWFVYYHPGQWRRGRRRTPVFAYADQRHAVAAAEEASGWCTPQVWEAEANNVRDCPLLSCGSSYYWSKFWAGEIAGTIEDADSTVIADRLRLVKRVWPAKEQPKPQTPEICDHVHLKVSK